MLTRVAICAMRRLYEDCIPRHERRKLCNCYEHASGGALSREANHRLDERGADLDHEKANALARLKISALSDEQVAEIEAFCAEVREVLEYATFEDKQRY